MLTFASRTQFHGPSRGLLRDCTTGCGTDGSICGTICATDLHVALAVEVGHVPAVLLIIVVVGVGAVVAGGDALSVGGAPAVVEVVASLVSDLSSGAQSNLYR